MHIDPQEILTSSKSISIGTQALSESPGVSPYTIKVQDQSQEELL